MTTMNLILLIMLIRRENELRLRQTIIYIYITKYLCNFLSDTSFLQEACHLRKHRPFIAKPATRYASALSSF